MKCEDIQAFLDGRRVCEQSEHGAKISTTCLYPSADPVFVHVSRWGDGFRVTDGGGISRCTLVHGRDDQALMAGLSEARRKHGVSIEGGALVATVPDKEWLNPAILAVANGAALAAAVAIDHVTKKADRTLKELMRLELEKAVSPQKIAKDYPFRGHSGKMWEMDYAVMDLQKPILLKAVSPHPNSVNSNYAAFGDIGAHDVNGFCVYDRPLSPDDSSLLLQVATLTPIKSLSVGVLMMMQQIN